MPSLLLVLSLAAAATQPVGPTLEAGSRFGFRASVEGQAFEAEFRRFSVRPVLDAALLPTGFEVAVAPGEVDSGDAERDAEMRSAAWFDAQRHPTARFRAARVESAPGGGYVAHGELVLKGVGRSIAVPFDWTADAESIRMRGQVELDRRWFGVGPPDDSSVAAVVTVVFALQWALR